MHNCYILDIKLGYYMLNTFFHVFEKHKLNSKIQETKK